MVLKQNCCSLSTVESYLHNPSGKDIMKLKYFHFLYVYTTSPQKQIHHRISLLQTFRHKIFSFITVSIGFMKHLMLFDRLLIWERRLSKLNADKYLLCEHKESSFITVTIHWHRHKAVFINKTNYAVKEITTIYDLTSSVTRKFWKSWLAYDESWPWLTGLLEIRQHPKQLS